MGIFINGVGVVGAFGSGAGELIACLDKGTPTTKLQAAADGQAYLADTSSLEAFVPKKSLRRIDHFSQMAILGAFLAIQDAGLPCLDAQRTGLIVCSGYGASQTTFSFLDSFILDGDSCASPTLFSNSVHNSAVGHISILLKMGGPCLTVSQFEMSVHSSLVTALQWLNEGRVDQVLLGAVDEYCDVLGYCRRRFFGYDDIGVMTPFSQERQSAIPGEGSAFFLLSKEKRDNSRCGAVVDVCTGRLKNKRVGPAERSVYFLGADGHKGCDRLYSEIIPQGVEAACYSPLYGSLPTGAAFDMAIAALSIREGRIFGSPESVADQQRFRVIRAPSVMDEKSITCVKLAKEDEFGLITLATE
jgi:3-oxoacyl-[acyl-carrier-protein] synthase II